MCVSISFTILRLLHTSNEKYMCISCHMYIHHVDTLLHVVSSSKLFRDFVVNVLVVLYAFNEALRAYYHARTVSTL